MSRLLVLLVPLLWVSPASAARQACEPAGIDAAAVAATRRAIASTCPCDGFATHSRYVRCAVAVAGEEIDAGRLERRCRGTVRRIARDSTCSFQKAKTTCCETRGSGRRCAIRNVGKCGGDACTARFCADADCAVEGPGSRCACPAEVVYGPEGNRLRRYDIDTIKEPPLVEDVLIPAGNQGGRDINGQVCLLPDGSGRFLAGEDTGQPNPPAGWGVFEADGTQVGKLTPTYTPGVFAEPFGCAFDPQGRLFTSAVGNQALFVPGTGQLIMWFPPYDHFPGAPGTYPNSDRSTNFCIIASDIATAGSVAVDELGRVYVTSASSFRVLRYSPPFPTGPDAAGGCGGTDPSGGPLADTVQVETFISGGPIVPTPTGIVRAPNGNWFIASVLTGVIAEFTPGGAFVRRILEPPPGEPAPTVSTGNPQGLAVDCHGDLYFADLNLVVGGGGNIGPGPNGKVRWIPFDAAGNPGPPIIVRQNLAFPDAVAVFPGDLENP